MTRHACFLSNTRRWAAALALLLVCSPARADSGCATEFAAPAVDVSIGDLQQQQAQLRSMAVPEACEAARRTAHAQRRLAADRYAPPQDGSSLAKALPPGFAFAAGDIILLLRAPGLVGAAVSQIGEYPGFFSHAAIVGHDPGWNTLDVIESVLDDGVRTVPLQEWLAATPFVRMAVYRHRDAALAKRAASAAYADATARMAEDLYYDIALRLDDPERLYCTEVIRRAYAAAAPFAPPVPVRLSTVGALVETFPLTALGAAESQVFLADDIEFDPRFEPVLELRAPAVIAGNAATERVFRELYAELRGPQRAQVMAEIDRHTPHRLTALPALLGSLNSAYEQVPPKARPRLAGFALLALERLKAGPQGQKSAELE